MTVWCLLNPDCFLIFMHWKLHYIVLINLFCSFLIVISFPLFEWVLLFDSSSFLFFWQMCGRTIHISDTVRERERERDSLIYIEMFEPVYHRLNNHWYPYAVSNRKKKKKKVEQKRTYRWCKHSFGNVAREFSSRYRNVFADIPKIIWTNYFTNFLFCFFVFYMINKNYYIFFSCHEWYIH